MRVFWSQNCGRSALPFALHERLIRHAECFKSHNGTLSVRHPQRNARAVRVNVGGLEKAPICGGPCADRAFSCAGPFLLRLGVEVYGRRQETKASGQGENGWSELFHRQRVLVLWGRFDFRRGAGTLSATMKNAEPLCNLENLKQQSPPEAGVLWSEILVS